MKFLIFELTFFLSKLKLIESSLILFSSSYPHNILHKKLIACINSSVLSFFSSSLKTIMAVAENYPELKANQNFTKLSEELASTENKIAFSRQFYNDTVTMYNTKLQVFPSNIIAGMFNFIQEELFKTDEESRQNVKVDFGK